MVALNKYLGIGICHDWVATHTKPFRLYGLNLLGAKAVGSILLSYNYGIVFPNLYGQISYLTKIIKEFGLTSTKYFINHFVNYFSILPNFGWTVGILGFEGINFQPRTFSSIINDNNANEIYIFQGNYEFLGRTSKKNIDLIVDNYNLNPETTYLNVLKDYFEGFFDGKYVSWSNDKLTYDRIGVVWLTSLFWNIPLPKPNKQILKNVIDIEFLSNIFKNVRPDYNLVEDFLNDGIEDVIPNLNIEDLDRSGLQIMAIPKLFPLYIIDTRNIPIGVTKNNNEVRV
jgi:AraC-like DNA-binding protein